MAGDWIKFEISTPDKPEVFEIASDLDIDPDAVIGKLIRVWGWFDQHTEEGNAPVTVKALLDRKSGVSGFVNAMIRVGWAMDDGRILSLPNFSVHNGQTAKRRALTAKRVSKHKSGANAPSVTKSVSKSVTPALPREEKRREEKNKDLSSTASVDPESEPEFWLSAKGKKLSGQRLEAFKKFWEAFNYKQSRASAIDSWINIPSLTNALVEEICTAAKFEFQNRPNLAAKDITPKQAQGWITERRWENDQLSIMEATSSQQKEPARGF